jgi:hypothetical protein
VILLGLLVALPVFLRASDQAVASEGSVEQPINPCRLYGSVGMPRHAAQVFAIDVKANTTQMLGGAIELMDVSGLAVHPYTQEIYALHVGQRGAKTTSLMRLDTASGATEWIGALGLEHGEGLSFRPGDASLWSWWRDHGLIRIDPVTADVQLVQAGDLPVSALAWHPNGDVLYLAGNRSLWAYQEGSAGLRLVQEPLPVLVGGMAIRGDGQLLLSAADTGTTGLDVLVFDAEAGRVVATFGVPALAIDSGRSRGGAAAFVKSLSWPLACGNFSPGGPADLIQNVELDPSTLCSGESAMIRVEASHPEGSDNPVRVSIDGLPGEQRSLQFEGLPGPRLVNVSASTDEGYVDGGTWEVEIVDCGPVRTPARLSVGMNPYQPYVVDFLVANAAEIAPEGAQYDWDFGNGLEASTSVPFVSHSYEEALLPDQEYLYFHASVEVQLPDATSLKTLATVSLWNAYANGRTRGLIQPLLTYEQEMASSGAQLVGQYTLRNLEDDPITFSQRRVEHQPCDAVLDPDPAPWESISLVIGPGEVLEDSLVLDAATVPEHVCGVALHLAGESGPVDRVAADLYFEIKRDALSYQPVTDPATVEMLTDVVERGLVENPDLISDEELYRLSQAGLIDKALAGASTSEPSQGTTEEAPDCEVDPIQIDCPCERGDVPSGLPGNVGEISCQATDAFAAFPAHLPNALKGDAILVGGCGFVGELLNVLEQRYVHTGIMTRNYVEIAHSTSTEGRAGSEDHLRYLPTPHIFASVLRYGWPGIIRSDVDTAFSTLRLNDDWGDTYELNDFTAEPSGCPGTIVPPLVVKPPPAQAQTVRPLLQAAADIARDLATPIDEWDPNGQWGTGNYRFYAYTDATIVDDAGYDHPSGQPATVCSTFVWHVLKSAGAYLEGPDLEPEEVSINWSHGNTDGLYLYPEAGRRSAAGSMWTNVYDTVMTKSFYDPLFHAIATAIANQLVNCFARDDCDFWDTYDQDWKNPGDGRTVSPDNLLLWDPPTDEDGDGVIDYGVYGHSERLVFRSGGYKRVYRWAPSEGTGTVAGVVRYEDGTPATEATVILEAAGGLETVSGPGGQFEFLAVPAGTYGIVAQKQEPDRFLSSRDGVVTVVEDKKTKVELVLLPPLEDFRRVNVTGTWLIFDVEYIWLFICFPAGGIDSGDITGLACRVDPYTTPTDTATWHQSLGDADLNITMNCELREDNAVFVEISSNLDGQSHRSQSALLPPDQVHDFDSVNMTSSDGGICGSWNDVAGHQITVSNEVQNY